MPDEKKKPLHPARSDDLERNVRGHPETNFLPPLDMVLSFFKKKDKPSVVNNAPQEPEEVHEQDVKRIINHITHDEQQQSDQKTKD